MPYQSESIDMTGGNEAQCAGTEPSPLAARLILPRVHFVGAQLSPRVTQRPAANPYAMPQPVSYALEWVVCSAFADRGQLELSASPYRNVLQLDKSSPRNEIKPGNPFIVSSKMDLPRAALIPRVHDDRSKLGFPACCSYSSCASDTRTSGDCPWHGSRE